MQITWWEHDELIDHFHSRPDLWMTDNGSMWVRKMQDGTPAFALQIIAPQDSGPYRMYTLFTSPCDWEEAYIADYLEKLVYFWTSYSTRHEFEQLMQSELQLDQQTAYLMSIALMRATVDPKENPDKTMASPPKQSPLWDFDLPTAQPERFVGRKLLPYPGGSITLTQHHGQCRVRFEICTARTANGWHTICMTGWARPLGYTLENFFKMMEARSDTVETEDPEAELPEPLALGLEPDEEGEGEVNNDAGC